MLETNLLLDYANGFVKLFVQHIANKFKRARLTIVLGISTERGQLKWKEWFHDKDQSIEILGGSDDWAKGGAGIEYSYTIELPDTGPYGFVLPTRHIRNVTQEAFVGVEAMVKALWSNLDESRGNSRATSIKLLFFIPNCCYIYFEWFIINLLKYSYGYIVNDSVAYSDIADDVAMQ